MNITKEQLLSRVTSSLLADTPVECSFHLLRFAFGFTRISTEVALFGHILGKTEENLSWAPKHKIIQNVIDWANENGVSCYYTGHVSPLRDTFIFEKFIPKQTQ